jgi:hypothetical protein
MPTPHNPRLSCDGPRTTDRGRGRRRLRASFEPLEDRSLLSASAVIQWSMAPRITLDPAHGDLPDLPNTPAYVNPPGGYTVDLDASQSAGIQPSSTFAWTVAGPGGFTATLAGEDPTINLPQGAYSVTLTASNLAGASGPQVATTSIQVKDVLIVAIGDSYASGEGNPVVASPIDPQWAYSPSPSMNTENADAHRSTISGPADFAYQLQQANPQEAVTFVSVAASGASIPDGVLGPMASVGDPSVQLPDQIDELKSIIGTQHIDVLTMSVGADDIGVSTLVDQFINNTYTGSPSRRKILSQVNARIARLPSEFAELATAIGSLDPGRVLATDYPDITLNQRRRVAAIAGPMGLPLVSRADARLTSRRIIAPLDAKIAAAAGRYGWTLVPGITNDFRTHGYPSTTPWIRTLSQSLATQGSPVGTFHPNAAGQADIALRILDAYLGQATTTPTRRRPTRRS